MSLGIFSILTKQRFHKKVSREDSRLPKFNKEHTRFPVLEASDVSQVQANHDLCTLVRLASLLEVGTVFIIR